MRFRVAREGARWRTVDLPNLKLATIRWCAKMVCGERGRLFVELPHEFNIWELNNIPGFVSRQQLGEDSKALRQYPSAIGVVEQAILFQAGVPWKPTLTRPYRLPIAAEPSTDVDESIWIYND